MRSSLGPTEFHLAPTMRSKVPGARARTDEAKGARTDREPTRTDKAKPPRTDHRQALRPYFQLPTFYRLPVEQNLHRVFARRQRPRVLHVELGRGVVPVRHILLSFADHAAAEQPARLERAGAGALGQYRDVQRIGRL